MNKILKLFFVLIVCLLPIEVLAIGSVKVNTKDITILKGETSTFSIEVENAVGRIDIVSSNDKIASVSDKFCFLDMESKTITVNGLMPGNTVIRVINSDVSTYDSEDISNNVYTINVIVKDYIKGDINRNDRIDLADIMAALKKYLDNNIDEDEIKFIDMNDNGKVDLGDITLLLKAYLDN